MRLCAGVLVITLVALLCSGCAAKPIVVNDIRPSDAHLLKDMSCYGRDFKMSVGAAKILNEYREAEGRGAFAVTRDGNMAEYWRCPSGRCSEYSMVQNLRTYCSGISTDSNECRVLFLGDKSVCDYPVSVRDSFEIRAVPEDSSILLGPNSAEGVILYFPGYSGWVWPYSSDCIAPPPYLKQLRVHGFDLFQINIPFYNMSASLLPQLAKEYVRIIDDYKRKGYKKIVVAGQSRGAWSALESSSLYSDEDVYYILTAPAAHGRVGQSNRLGQADDDLQVLLEKSNATNLIVFYFNKDLYATGNGPDLFRENIKGHAGWNVVGFPSELVGHGAMWTPLFAKTFVTPLKEFIAEGKFQWKDKKPSPGVFEDISSEKHINAAGLEELSPKQIVEVLTGAKLYFVEAHGRGDISLEFGEKTVKVYLWGKFVRGNEYLTSWDVNNGKLSLAYTHKGEFADSGKIVPLKQEFKVFRYDENRLLLLRLEDGVVLRRYLG